MYHPVLSYGIPYSDVEEHGLVLTLQNDIKAVDDARPFLVAGGKQRRASILRHAQQDGIAGIGWLIGEVQARHEVVEQASREHSDTDMGRLPALCIKRHGSRLDGLKPVESLVLGARATKAHKGGAQGRRSLVQRMEIAPMSVSLPDLDQGIGNRQPVTIQDMSFNANTLAGSLRFNQNVTFRIRAQQRGREKRPDRLRAGQHELAHIYPSFTGSNGVAEAPASTMSQ